MDKEEQIKKLIEYFKGCETVTFSLTGIGEYTFETIEFKEAIRFIENKIEIIEDERIRQVNRDIDDMEWSLIHGY